MPVAEAEASSKRAAAVRDIPQFWHRHDNHIDPKLVELHTRSLDRPWSKRLCEPAVWSNRGGRAELYRG